MSKSIFWDTSGWFCLYVKSEELHKKTLKLADSQIQNKIPIITSDFVIQETMTLFMARGQQNEARQFWANFKNSKIIRVEKINENRFTKSGDFFCDQIEQSNSFTDVSSFLLMKELKIHTAVTLDKHFVKAGFQVLP
jgi:predicted nucleic acid-binding protein